MAVIAGVVGIVGLTNIKDIDEADTLLYQHNTLGIKYSSDSATNYQRIKYNMAEIILLKDDLKKEEYAKNISTYIDNIDNNLKKYETECVSSEENRQLLNTVKSYWEQYKTYLQEALRHILNGEYKKAETVLLDTSNEVGDALRQSIITLVEYNQERAEERAEENEELADHATSLMFVIILVAIVLAVVLGLFISRALSRPIGKLVIAAEKLALGDMDIERSVFTKDEIGQLAAAFEKVVRSTREQAETVQRIADGDLTADVQVRSEKDLLGQKLSEMVGSLNNLVLNISAAAEQVSAGARQISDSSMELSQGATEQASSIEELTASIEEIASQTKVNAENASKANTLSEQTMSYALTGNTRMQEMLKAMDEINQSSSNIKKIIKVIDDIAFQTNILALNAAVEAARAGQHGKGFAVVAEEVRNLAGQSANAAKDTTALIEDSIKKAEDGTKIAKETAEALEKIVEGVQTVSNLVGDINSASNEQAAAIAQVNEGISLVSQVVQANSATSEESAAASEELSSQAETLKELIERFKVKNV